MSSKNFIDLLGLETDSISKKFSDISFKDYIKDNESITGAFNELSEDKQKSVIDSLNMIQNTVGKIFGIKTDKFTADDFKGSTVNVSTKVYNDKNSESNTCSERECSANNISKSKSTTSSICADLLAEVESSNKAKIIDTVVDYVIKTLTNKKDKKYILHEKVGTVPPAVEVKIPTNIVNDDIIDDVMILNPIREKLKEKVGSSDVYVQHGENNSVTVYIPLK